MVVCVCERDEREDTESESESGDVCETGESEDMQQNSDGRRRCRLELLRTFECEGESERRRNQIRGRRCRCVHGGEDYRMFDEGLLSFSLSRLSTDFPTFRSSCHSLL